MMAKKLDAPKARAAGILIVDAWEREMEADPERDEKLKWLAASQERDVVERHERGLEMVREWSKTYQKPKGVCDHQAPLQSKCHV